MFLNRSLAWWLWRSSPVSALQGSIVWMMWKITLTMNCLFLGVLLCRMNLSLTQSPSLQVGVMLLGALELKSWHFSTWEVLYSPQWRIRSSNFCDVLWELQLIQSLSQLSDFLEQYMDGEILSSVCITLCSYVCGTFYSLLLHPQICYIYFFFIWNWVVDEVTIFLKYFSKAEHVWLRSAFKYHCWAPEVQNSSSVLWYCCWPVCLEENLKWVAAVCNCVTVL